MAATDRALETQWHFERCFWSTGRTRPECIPCAHDPAMSLCSCALWLEHTPAGDPSVRACGCVVWLREWGCGGGLHTPGAGICLLFKKKKACALVCESVKPSKPHRKSSQGAQYDPPKCVTVPYIDLVLFLWGCNVSIPPKGATSHMRHYVSKLFCLSTNHFSHF